MVAFPPLRISCDLSFWSELNRLKLEIWHLDESPQPLVATLPHNAKFSSDYFLTLDASSLHPPEILDTHHVEGRLILFNTKRQLEEFQTQMPEKTVEFSSSLELMISQQFIRPRKLLSFTIVMYADLKHFEYYYLTFVPSVVLSENFRVQRHVFNEGDVRELAGFTSERNQEYPVLWNNNQQQGFENLNTLNPNETWFIYPSLGHSDKRALSWEVPNLLYALSVQPVPWGLVRIGFLGANGTVDRVLHFSLPNNFASNNTPEFYGWHDQTPEVSKLSGFFDRNQLMNQAVDLNLKLTRWRMVPNLKLDKFNAKVLIIGAGTLGCNLARGLMGWGLKNITFVDCGTVSVSNPVRQSLFIADDINKPKAEAAADALKRIFPSINAKGVALKVVMPGHPAPANSVLEDVDNLQELIASHDFIFLCTDSRESRWLPTILAVKHKKPVINIALGFDSFMVMRHGIHRDNEDLANLSISLTVKQDYNDRFASVNANQLACYFCLDVTAPGDSVTNRTIDQQCTISRSGLSFLACGYAVELFASLVQHYDGPYAPARLNNVNEIAGTLGGTPHQIRGFLRSFSLITPTTMRSNVCSACGPAICTQLSDDRLLQELVLTATTNPSIIETICGITDVQHEAEKMERAILTFGDSDDENPFDLAFDENDGSGNEEVS